MFFASLSRGAYSFRRMGAISKGFVNSSQVRWACSFFAAGWWPVREIRKPWSSHGLREFPANDRSADKLPGCDIRFGKHRDVPVRARSLIREVHSKPVYLEPGSQRESSAHDLDSKRRNLFGIVDWHGTCSGFETRPGSAQWRNCRWKRVKFRSRVSMAPGACCMCRLR